MDVDIVRKLWIVEGVEYFKIFTGGSMTLITFVVGLSIFVCGCGIYDIIMHRETKRKFLKDLPIIFLPPMIIFVFPFLGAFMKYEASYKLGQYYEVQAIYCNDVRTGEFREGRYLQFNCEGEMIEITGYNVVLEEEKIDLEKERDINWFV